jgi:hypothetical protein
MRLTDVWTCLGVFEKRNVVQLDGAADAYLKFGNEASAAFGNDRLPPMTTAKYSSGT